MTLRDNRGEIRETPDCRSYHRTNMQREMILTKLKEKGCRITRQRRVLIDIILENECSSCKEIFYKASGVNDKIGTATVYRMVNVLEEIGAISRKNMYRVAYSDNCTLEDACVVALDDDTVCHLSGQKWNSVVKAGLKACGYLGEQKITSITIRPCECEIMNC